MSEHFISRETAEHDLLACAAFLAESIGGSDGLLWEGDTKGDGDLSRGWLRSRANSIEGGTTEVMKNILGERVLGLPGDIRVDRDKPWSEVPRS